MVQSCPEASPVKWHLAHTAWFFESFVLREFLPEYRLFNAEFPWLFNSYYRSFSAFPEKRLRASFSRPGLDEVLHYRGYIDACIERLIDGIDGHTVVAAVFRRREDMEGFVADVKAADLGVSINISAPIDAAQGCCRKAGLTRHSVEYSIGFQGRVERLPESAVLEVSTMCGHGMVSHNLVKKLIEMVREGRRTPEQAAACLARFCTCGVFNVPRAERLIETARTGSH